MNSLISVAHSGATLRETHKQCPLPPAGCGLCVHIVPAGKIRDVFACLCVPVCVYVCELDEGDIRCVRETREEKERKGKGGDEAAQRARQGLKQQWRKRRFPLERGVEVLHPGGRSSPPSPLRNGKMRHYFPA